MSGRSRLALALTCMGICVGLFAATTCVTGGWPVAETSVQMSVVATPAAGGSGVAVGVSLETRFATQAWADDFALDTRPLRGLCVFIR